MLCDATPLACRAGHIAGCKIAIVSNFTWDICYKEMLDAVRESLEASTLSAYENVIRSCEEDYSYAHMYLQLPGETPIPRGFDSSRVVPGPLVARLPRRSRHEMRELLGISRESNTLLLCFGGHSSDWDLLDAYLPEGWVCIVQSPHASREIMPSNRYIVVSPEDAYVPDLIQASDVVLGKLGYGFMSECLSCGAPLLFISRTHWAEEKYLKSFMMSHHGCIEMPIEHFSTGQWGQYLARAVLMSRGIRRRGTTEGVPLLRTLEARDNGHHHEVKSRRRTSTIKDVNAANAAVDILFKSFRSSNIS